MAQNGLNGEHKIPETANFVCSELWKRKLKTLFCCIDADKNGYLNREDLPVLAGKFQKYGHMSDDDTNTFAEKLTLWWDNTMQKGLSVDFQVLTVSIQLCLIFSKMDSFL